MKLRDCQEVAHAPDVQALELRLLQLANDLGFGLISVNFVVEHPLGEAHVWYFGNTPEQFKSLSKGALRKRDPVMRRLKQFASPVIYDQSIYVKDGAEDLWELRAPYGYKTGLAMSLHLPERRHFVLGVDREQSLPSDEIEVARLMADLHLLAVQAAAKARSLGSI